MTRKDYVLIAAAIRPRLQNAVGKRRYHMVVMANDIAAALKADNSMFNTDVFLTACGVRVED